MAKKTKEEEIYDAFCDTVKTELTRTRFDRDGNETGCPAAVLAVVKDFLKDNHISQLPVKGSKVAGVVDTLVKLPFEETMRMN